MNNHQARPRILCIRPAQSQTASSMLVDLGGEWVPALRHHAELQVLQGNFDLAVECDAFRPDLILYEAAEYARPWLGTIRNQDACPQVPRVLLLNCDPHNPLRPFLYGLRGAMRFEAVFQFGIEHSQLMPELRWMECFSLPLFIDPEVFTAEPCDKLFPVTVFSADLMPDFYHWRAKLVRELPLQVPTLLYPHPGYVARNSGPFSVRGKDYARILAMSHFAAADTTRLDYVVRKHLEIPAAGAVLIAPPSDALADYGFRDGENCLLGSGEELVSKIRQVMREPGRYAAICASGIALVHGRYTRQAWTGLLEWLDCRSRLAPGQVVRQDGPLGRFFVAEAGALARSFPERESEITALLRSARDAILHGSDAQATAADLRNICSWLAHMSEPWFLLGILCLMNGQMQDGIRCIGRRPNAFQSLSPLHQRLDPVETAWLWMAAHLAGLSDMAEAMRQQAGDAEHLALRRARWLLSSEGTGTDGLDHRWPGDTLSIHWLGQEALPVWGKLVARVWAESGHVLPQHVATRIGHIEGSSAGAM